jgi:hypothetical protein
MEFVKFCQGSKTGRVAVHVQRPYYHPDTGDRDPWIIPDELADLFSAKGLDATHDYSAIIFDFRPRVHQANPGVGSAVLMTHFGNSWYSRGKPLPPSLAYCIELSRREALAIFRHMLEPILDSVRVHDWIELRRRKLPDWSSSKRANFNKRSRAIARK